MANMFNPMVAFGDTFSVQYVSGSIWMSVRNVNNAFFEQANQNNPTVVMTLDRSIIAALTSAMSTALSQSA